MYCSARIRAGAAWYCAGGMLNTRRSLRILSNRLTNKHVQYSRGSLQGIAVVTFAGAGLGIAVLCSQATHEIDALGVIPNRLRCYPFFARALQKRTIMAEPTWMAKANERGDAHCTPYGFDSWPESKRPTVLLLVRHGERIDYVDPAWIRRNHQAEPWNPPLSKAGEEQADALSLAVESWCQKLGMKLGAVYSSPFLRTKQTAKPTAERFGLEVKPVAHLMEWLAAEFYTAWACQDSTGHWGSGQSEIMEQFVGIVHQPAADLLGMRDGPLNNLSTPESQETMTKRVSSCIETLAAEHAGKIVLVVGHGGPTAFSAGRLCSVPTSEISMAEYTGIYALIRQPAQSQWTLLACNDVRHLSSL